MDRDRRRQGSCARTHARGDHDVTDGTEPREIDELRRETEAGAGTLLTRLRRTFKPRNVEEPIDYYWHRPLAALLVEGIKDWPVTPNQVTLASGFVSILSGCALTLGAYVAPWWAALGGALLLLSIVLDCADGQLARLRGTSSPIGRVLDGFADILAPVSVYLGMTLYLLAHGNAHSQVWPLAWASSLSLLWHAQVYDANKNVHLHASRPDFSLGGATLMTPEAVYAYADEYRANGERVYAFMMRFFAGWTRSQLGAVRPWLDPARSPQNELERALYLRIFGRSMAVLTWLGLGTHLFLLTVAAWLTPLTTVAIWLAWLIIAGPMNVACAWQVWTQRARVTAFERQLASLRASS
ncbi:MAG: CDP-alcohol phosphatidyltransferase family protein [Myxococcales bacterium]|nr:CDP-alcohol phosphatidyltransferase family protein [Myxococcales bacterium]